MANAEHDKRDRALEKPKARRPAADTEFIDDPHGRHGGSEESEGQPQDREPARDEDDTTETDEIDENEDRP